MNQHNENQIDNESNNVAVVPYSKPQLIVQCRWMMRRRP